MELSFTEIVLVFVIAFVVLGPEEMIRRSQQIGRFVGKARTQINNWKILAEEQIVKNEEVKRLKDFS
jgi:sec-independent protein translocase protein TatB